MSIAIIKYTAGNIRSVDCALRRLGVEPVVTADEETLRRAGPVVFSGVGGGGPTGDSLRTSGFDRGVLRL